MADEVPAPAPEIDVDALDDKAFAELKGKMRAEQPIEAPPKPEQGSEAPKAQTTDKAAPESNADDLDDDEPADGKIDKIDFKRYDHERNRRKEAQARADQAIADRAKALDRLQQLLERDTAQPQRQVEQEPAIPDPDTDPIGALKWMREQVVAANERQQTETRQRQEAQQNSQQWQAIIETANNQFVEREKTQPEVRDAYNALKESYMNELRALGHTPQSAAAEMERIEAQNIAWALQNRVHVADHVLNLAKVRGWQPKAPAPANDAGQTEAERIARREETRLAAQSLGKGGGAVVNTGVITPEQLLEMSDEDFEAYKKKHGSVAHAFRQAS